MQRKWKLRYENRTQTAVLRRRHSSVSKHDPARVKLSHDALRPVSGDVKWQAGDLVGNEFPARLTYRNSILISLTALGTILNENPDHQCAR